MSRITADPDPDPDPHKVGQSGVFLSLRNRIMILLSRYSLLFGLCKS